MRTDVNQRPKVTFSVPEAVAATSVGRSKIYAEIQAGRLKSFKLGTRTLIAAEDLRAWLDSYRQMAGA